MDEDLVLYLRCYRSLQVTLSTGNRKAICRACMHRTDKPTSLEISSSPKSTPPSPAAYLLCG
jgi:hypothetical protein